jgi:hypothetical protein
MDLNKVTKTQKLNILLNHDNKDDLLIVGSYLKKSMATSKLILGEEIILSFISSFSINLLVLTYNYNYVNTVIALAALNRFEIIIII